VAFRKDDLFDYDGRPVIYSDEASLGKRLITPGGDEAPWVYEGGIPEDMQYLWVGYGPNDVWYRPYPNDWTHEREWRARPNIEANRKAYMGASAPMGVPLLLPTNRPNADSSLRFIVLVAAVAERDALNRWVTENVEAIRLSGTPYAAMYATALQKAPVLSFEDVKGVLDATNNRLGRLEDFFPITV